MLQKSELFAVIQSNVSSGRDGIQSDGKASVRIGINSKLTPCHRFKYRPTRPRISNGRYRFTAGQFRELRTPRAATVPVAGATVAKNATIS